MRPRTNIPAIVLTMVLVVLGQPRAVADRALASGPPRDRPRASPARGPESAESTMLGVIRNSEGSLSLTDLTATVRVSLACCNRSLAISTALAGWLRENHPIHSGRRPSDVVQFRAFLLAALGAFPPSAELYGYVKTELVFGGHPSGIAAAAVAARSFPERSEDLLPLMEPYLDSSFDDESVDITTPALNYPLAHPTRARHEIIRTLRAWGHRAYRSVPLLDAIVACHNCGSYSLDSELPGMAAQAAAYIRAVTLPCCRTAAPRTTPRGLQLIRQADRKPFSMSGVKLLDQDGQSLQFSDLAGRPFALAFFYTQCPNALKCVATVRRLRDLEAECGRDHLSDRVGIYGMTYDPRFDTPSILQKYGKLHGFRFGEHVRLLKTVDELGPALRGQLDLRVSYGAGSVNQHGIQLFLFDKKGRLAAIHDNELWSTVDVKNCLARLAAE
jgi:cytochrome oxidase Cu insertion factor (SCO1/SenC/PrrC family)